MSSKRTLFGQVANPAGANTGMPRPHLPMETIAMAAVDEAGVPIIPGSESPAGLQRLGAAPQPTAGNTISAIMAGNAPTVEIELTQHTLPTDQVDGRLVLLGNADSPQAAAFRVLRHHLLEHRRPQVIVVTSPRDGDGKTTTAINLALALAECGRAKVLLIDANLRRPEIASVLRFVPPWCFAEQLAAHRHQPMLPWSMIEIPQLWLHVAAVNMASKPTNLVDAPAFAIAMERLRTARYDHIVIDGPSILGGAEVNLIQDAADGVVLALRSGRSNARDIRNAIDQITPAKIFGSVLLEA
ncbi:MAG: CpsD/CapB family tyrosine-protein kinase [Kofleriaceae bacterium]|nr:CpsD/CapB family tyrosine-protein kinase [Kofleriaceae bacterium]